ncbi:hypothetical protein EDD22DRAFT_170690 [Suillus occidentalis]|nr:hypothetical protein EDD22DRAFT_170690 [Suillus occidentalis]
MFDYLFQHLYSQSSTAHPTHTLSSAYHPRRALAPSSADLRALLNRISSFFHHSRSNTDATTELQQRPACSIISRGPRIVEVATVQDRKPLAVAPQQVRRTHATGTTAPGATPTPIPWWAHVVLFLCCASPRQPTQSQQQQQSQAHGQVQTQESSSQPAAPSTSTPVISTTLPNAATVQSQPLPLRARIVLFLCCVSSVHAYGH